MRAGRRRTTTHVEHQEGDDRRHDSHRLRLLEQQRNEHVGRRDGPDEIPLERDDQKSDEVDGSDGGACLQRVLSIPGLVAGLPSEDDEPVVEQVDREEDDEHEAHRDVDEDPVEQLVRVRVPVKGQVDGRTV